MWSGTERGSMNKKDLEKYKKSLPPEVLKNMQIGGKTQSPMGDLAILGATAAAVKGAPLMIGKLGGAAKGLLKNEVAKMTISKAAYKKGMLPELTRSGIKNWQHLRPWNAFLPKTPLTPGGTLQTLPTPAAAGASGLLIEGAGAPPAIAGGPRLPGESGSDAGLGSMSWEDVQKHAAQNPGSADKLIKTWKKLHGGINLPKL